MNTLIIDGINQRITQCRTGKRKEPPPKNKKTPGEAGKERAKAWYIRKSPQAVNRFITKIKKFYEQTKFQPTLKIWVTITTSQHKTGLTDKDLLYKFRLYWQHKKLPYLLTVERQRNTGDLHFHLLTSVRKTFDFTKEVSRLAKLFQVKPHPSVFDARHIKDIKGIQIYISKYIRKSLPPIELLEKWYNDNPENYSPPYSSLFFCRTFTGSQNFTGVHDTNSKASKFTIPIEFTNFLNLKGHEEKTFDYAKTYKYDADLLKRINWLRMALTRAGILLHDGSIELPGAINEHVLLASQLDSYHYKHLKESYNFP